MSFRNWIKSGLLPTPAVSLYDLALAVAVVLGGLAYHWDFGRWSIGLVGGAVYGDAEFWWDGALQVADANFRHHPGLGMRPGFFIGAGLTVPVLGTAPEAFHKFLLALFLATTVVFYLILRKPLGRWGASCGALLLVFNPTTARWLATPTTDGLGLVLHLLALCFLLGGTADGLRPGRLAAFGALFALGTLTRPLITPFIGLAALCVLLFPGAPWRRRAGSAAITVGAYFVPTFLWMLVQHTLVGEWSISTNDASAFYAASEPSLQVWSPQMYEPVAAEARQRFGRPPTNADLNAVFWKRTKANYAKHYRYHLNRLVPHLWAVASPSPVVVGPDTVRRRTELLAALASLLCWQLLFRRQWLRSMVLGVATAGIWLSPQVAGFLTCAGVALALTTPSGPGAERGRIWLAAYWLCGVAALYAIGGTWGPPLPGHTEVTLNSLGYRLGAQVFFAGDLLAVLCLVQLASLNLPPRRDEGPARPIGPRFVATATDRLLRAPSPIASRLVRAALGITLVVVAATYATGTILVAQHWYSQRKPRRVPMPSPAPAVAYLAEATGRPASRPVPVAQSVDALGPILALDKKVADSGDFVALGELGTYVWNLPAQRRSLAHFHAQRPSPPYVRGRGTLNLQFPDHIPAAQWAGAKGAFLLRSLPDSQNHWHLPTYLNAVVVRAFVPLSADGATYDVGRAVRFPLALYASQLHAAGLLGCSDARIEWAVDAAEEGRRFDLFAQPEATTGRASLKLDVSRLSGTKTLSLAFRRPANGTPMPPEAAAFRIEGLRRGTDERAVLWSTQIPTSEVGPKAPLRRAQMEVGEEFDSLELIWDCASPTTPVWVYEFVVRADDLRN
jgi:Dolichyl-phosphate-mannose-protein mannosyltransferase